MRKYLSLVFVLSCVPLMAQQQPGASKILLKLKRLNYLGSVLYVAAHPDDENTRAIAYFANERLAATAYLSMTRGDGGQNLIGPEIRDLLGVIRTQELLAARRIDGGEQFFTRAVDFGFSKSYRETLAIWNKGQVLSDVVRVIRQYQPDVILTRFPPDERAGHGHHTSSAMLAQEAFDLAADSKAFPEQLDAVKPWQTKRLFTNTGRWWNTTINEKTPGVITVNVGSYNPLLGESYSEMAAESRTQHKSQGFGSPGRRGDAPEYFEFVKGEKAEKDVLDGVNTTWSRVPGGMQVEPLVIRAINEFNAEQPFLSVPVLLAIRKQIGLLAPGVWKDRKLKEVNELIQDCLGLFAEVSSPLPSAAPSDLVTLQFEVVNRSPLRLSLQNIQSPTVGLDSTATLELGPNQLIAFKSTKRVAPESAFSGPYWLKQPHSMGLFEVGNTSLIGKPQDRAPVVVDMTFFINDERLALHVPLINKWTDPVKGELWRPFEITPSASVSIAQTVTFFADTQARPIKVRIKSYSARPFQGDVRLEMPVGWKSMPEFMPVELGKRGEEKEITFMVAPPSGESVANVTAVFSVGGQMLNQAIDFISYDHIPTQTLISPANGKLIRMGIAKVGKTIAYVKGAGDEIPSALRNIGYEVWEMTNEEITKENLMKADAVVLGVRALNTNERIRYLMPELLAYVENGGTLVVQYNTNFDLELEPGSIAPFPLKLSRDRVTEENSAVTVLVPDHPVFNYPNKIVPSDFDGWVQERGLYFPSEWDPNFTALVSMHDEGEPDKKGGLLVAKYGRGHYVYTGLSFFRELPEGIPGAYKLFANLVSLGKDSTPEPAKVKNKKR